MILINLVRVRKPPRRRGAGERAVVAMGIATLVAAVALVGLTLSADAELARRVRANNAVKDEIDRLKEQLGDYDKVRDRRQELLKQQKTIAALKAGRTGPVFLLRELSEILTARKGPSFDRSTYDERLRREPNVGFDAGWDPRRVWLDSYDEAQRKVRIRGSARTNEDVAEFLKRLQLSVFFSQVTPESTTQVAETTGSGGARHVTFNVSARVVY